MPSLPLRIAILETDTPVEPIRAKYGDYGSLFTGLLKAGADALKHEGVSSTSGLDISSFDVVTAQEYPKLDDVDGILITGSKYNSFDNDPWILKLVEFTTEVLKQRRVRLIGVCFGHQIIGRTMGVKVDRSDKGWETSVVAVDLTKRGQEIFGRSSLVREPFDSCTDTVLTGSGDTSNASGYRLRISTRS
jgi:GMP synthase-like glutamine amidotransferase